MDIIELSFRLLQASALVEYVSGEEVRFQYVPIGEKLVAQIDETVLQVTAVQILGQSTVADQLAYVLGKAAAKVEQRGFRPRCA